MAESAKNPETRVFQILRDIGSAEMMVWVAAVLGGILTGIALPSFLLRIFFGGAAAVAILIAGYLLALRLFREHQFAKLSELVAEHPDVLEYLKTLENPLAAEYLNVRAALKVALPG